MKSASSNNSIILQSSLPNNKEMEVVERLREFLEKFIEHFVNQVKVYLEEATGNTSKSSKTANIAGVGFGLMLGDFGEKIGKQIGNTLGTIEHKERIKRRIKILHEARLDLKNIALRVGFDIYRCFENQFAEVTDSGGWQIAMGELAQEAIERIMDGIDDYANIESASNLYATEDLLCDLLCKCFFQGKSKGLIGHNIHKRKIMYKDAKCHVSSLYEKVGLVTLMHDSAIDKYFIKSDGSSRPTKYGYRLLFEHELVDDINLLNTIFKEDITPTIQDYTYLIKSSDVDSFKEDLLTEKDDLKEIKELLKQLNLEKKIEVSSRKILKHVWFEVRGQCVYFTGRRKYLEQVSKDIFRGILIVTGLSGVGKSELAIQFGHSKYTEGYNVIWINAETRETAAGSFRRLYKKLGFKIKDNDGEEKCIRVIVEDTYEYFSAANTLLILDNAENYKSIEDFLPLGLPSTSKQPRVIITSTYGEWRSNRCSLVVLKIDDFEEEEAEKFIRSYLEIESDADNSVKRLVRKLHNFPLALQHVATFIKYEIEILKNINPDRNIIDYLNNFNSRNRGHLKSRAFLNIDNTNGKTIFTIMQFVVDKIKNDKEFGELALLILNILAYFSSDGTPVMTFSALVDDEYKLACVIQLLKNNSVIRNQKILRQSDRDENSGDNSKREELHVHGLLREVIRLGHDDNTKDLNREEYILENALLLLRNYCNNSDYTSHIISVWNYAQKYDKLIEKFIVHNVYKNKTNFIHLISGFCKYEVFLEIIKKIESNHPETVSKIVNSKDVNRGTALHRAAGNGDERVVKILMEKGAKVNIKKKHGWTPLHLSSKNGHLEVTKILLPESNINAKTGYKFTCLHLAARNNHPDIVSVLLNEGIQVNSATVQKFTALHFALQMKNSEVVRILLNHDEINVNAETTFKTTPLHLASELGCLDIVLALIDKGAVCDAKNEDGFTPLHYAAFNSHINVVKALLENTIDVNSQTTNGCTSLHFAASKGSCEIVKELLEHRADADAKNKQGKTAADLALENNHAYVAINIGEHFRT